VRAGVLNFWIAEICLQASIRAQSFHGVDGSSATGRQQRSRQSQQHHKNRGNR
jgi:hypothetical protein